MTVLAALLLQAAAAPAPPPPPPPDWPPRRVLFLVDGVPLRAGELAALVAYFRTFRNAPDGELWRDAFAAWLPRVVMRARFAHRLPELHARVAAAAAELAAGADFAAVVARRSDDTEAPTPDGRYRFPRLRAVQPFDLFAFTEPVGRLSPPFLTKYGVPVLQVTARFPGDSPAEDEVEVRHVLAMYPELVALERAGEDVRAWIAARVDEAHLVVLERSALALVPPERRPQVVRPGAPAPAAGASGRDDAPASASDD